MEDIIVRNLEKGKQKTKNFSGATQVDQPESSVQLKQGEPEQQKNIYEETDQELAISRNARNIPK